MYSARSQLGLLTVFLRLEGLWSLDRPRACHPLEQYLSSLWATPGVRQVDSAIASIRTRCARSKNTWEGLSSFFEYIQPQSKIWTSGILPRPVPLLLGTALTSSKTPPALLSLTCFRSKFKISLSFHRCGTGLYAGLNVPTV